MKKDKIVEFFRRLKDLNPEPHSELKYSSPYTLLVAVVLSAQTTDVAVNRVTNTLFSKASTPSMMVKLGEAKVRSIIRTIGLNRNKAKNVIALSQLLLDNFSGEVPADLTALQSLPGVGRKTANVVLNVAFGEPTIAVDTHVFRVSNRTGLAHGKTPAEVEQKLIKSVPEKWKLHAHHWLILHGRYVCTARKPDCPRCRVLDLCTFKEKTTL